MTQHKFNLTLTRWHKVAERLQQEISRQSTEVESAYNRSAFSLATKVRRPELVEANTTTVEHALLLSERLLCTISTIRTELAKANAKLGVAERLAAVDGINKRIVLLESVVKNERERTVRYEDFLTMESTGASSDSLYGGRQTVSIKLLTDDRVTQLQEQAASLRRRVHGLTDEVADLNRSLLSIELPEDIAAIAGLSKE